MTNKYTIMCKSLPLPTPKMTKLAGAPLAMKVDQHDQVAADGSEQR